MGDGAADARARVREASERLGDARAGVRRIAALDLINVAGAGAGEASELAFAALLARLPRESDVKTALLMIDCLRGAGRRDAMPALLALYDDPGTDVEVAIEAVRAHDEIAARSGG